MHSLKKKKYLVTGGSGFIGSALVKKLVQKGHSVRVMDNNSRGSVARLQDVLHDIEFIEGDIREYGLVEKAVKGCDSVLHLAYVNGTKFFYENPELILEIAVKGIINVLDAAIKHNVPEFVLASSSEVYQEAPTIPTDETVPLIVPDVFNPRFSYGGGKIISELMAIHYGKKHFERTLIFRPHNVYGPNMGNEHVIPEFLLRMNDIPETGGEFAIQGTGTEKRSFIYIDDFVNGVDLILEKGENMGLYHIGTQDEIEMGELAQLVAQVCGKSISLKPTPLRQGSTPRRCPDISQLKSLGFAPLYTLTEGLAKTAPWYSRRKEQNGSVVSTCK